MKEKKTTLIYDSLIDVCLLSLGLWGGFLLILFAKRSMEEFKLGRGYDILLFFAVIGFAYLIIIHYRSGKKKEEE